MRMGETIAVRGRPQEKRKNSAFYREHLKGRIRALEEREGEGRFAAYKGGGKKSPR